MKSKLRRCNDNGVVYEALEFACPGCAEVQGGDGIHILPVNTGGRKTPSWDWDGNLEEPTLNPSILTRTKPYVDGQPTGVCHSYIRNGVFEFLPDCTHSLTGQQVPMPDLPEWAVEI